MTEVCITGDAKQPADEAVNRLPYHNTEIVVIHREREQMLR